MSVKEKKRGIEEKWGGPAGGNREERKKMRGNRGCESGQN